MNLSIVRCRILGQAEIHTRGIRLTPESELQFGLALYFCAQAGRDVPRDELTRLFWPGQGEEAARHCLRQSMYRLRVLGVAVHTGTRTTRLESHFVEADFAPAIAEGAPASAFLRLADVAVLPGYSPRFSRPFAHWVEDFRGDVGTKLRRGLVRAISEMRARGRYADVERLCRFCLRIDPLNEEATLALAESVALAGGKVEAVGLIDRYAGEVGRYQAELRVPASLLRERISDRLIRRNQAAVELPMIGREQDVERVLTAFQRLRGNRAVSYIVTGVAGVGKTRLASECCRMAEVQGARVLTIGTQPSSRTQALFAVSELVDGLLQMPGAIGCAPAALECLRGISSPVPMREPALSLDADGEARFAMVRWSILDVLDAILSEGPFVIHVDDAHQLDAQSQAILQDALRTHAGRPLLLLFTMRQPDASDAERFTRLAASSTLHDLLPLSDESCDRLVHRFCAVHEETVDDETRERIIHLSGGNPFFLVELLKHRSDLLTDDLPITVQALLEERLGRLSPTALTVLRAAAVLGLSSSVERLHRVVERRTSDVLGALTELHAAGMLSSADSGTQCRHDTIREAVLERTPTAARVLLHRRAARTLGREALREGGVALLWECVHHWRSAGSAKNGVRLALSLARRLLRIGLAQDSLQVLEEIEQKTDDPHLRSRALAGQARSARMLRQWDKVASAAAKWREAVAEHQPLPPPTHSAIELLVYEAHYNQRETYGSLPKSISDCVLSPHASVGHRLAAATLSMIRADNDGDELTANAVFTASVDLHARTASERIDALTTKAIYHAAFGRLQDVPALLNQFVDEGLKLRHPALKAHYVRRACFGLVRFGDATGARDLLIKSLELFQRLKLTGQAALCIEDLGALAQWQGNFDEALDWIDKAHLLHKQTEDSFCRAVDFELRVLLAFATNDRMHLPTFDMPSDISEALVRSRRGRQSVMALELIRKILSEDHAFDTELLQLQELHGAMKNRSYQDTIVAAIAAGLVANGSCSAATELLSEYFSASRRELRPVTSPLSRIAATLGLGQMASSVAIGNDPPHPLERRL